MNQVTEAAKAGFTYCVEHIRDGEVIGCSVDTNLMPVEGLNHVLTTELLGGPQVAAWFLGLTTNDYAPQTADVMATYAALAGETVAYDGTTRKAFTPGSVAGGVVDNAAARAEFTFSAPTTVRGGFLSSSNTRGGTAGVLLSAVRFASPKVVDTGDILRVTAGIQLTSA